MLLQGLKRRWLAVCLLCAAPTHGAKKDGLVNKIKEKLPGQHHTADGSVTHSDPNAPPKKGIVEKIKEKLPGHHGSSDAGM